MQSAADITDTLKRKRKSIITRNWMIVQCSAFNMQNNFATQDLYHRIRILMSYKMLINVKNPLVYRILFSSIHKNLINTKYIFEFKKRLIFNV